MAASDEPPNKSNGRDGEWEGVNGSQFRGPVHPGAKAGWEEPEAAVTPQLSQGGDEWPLLDPCFLFSLVQDPAPLDRCSHISPVQKSGPCVHSSLSPGWL